MRYASFLLFELCVGVYFPMSGTLKGSIVPEESRSAIYNLYRVPLNCIVVGALLCKIDLQPAFIMTTLLLLTAVIFQTRLCNTGRPYRPVGADTEFGLDDEPPLDEHSCSLGDMDDKSDELVTMIGNRS